MLRSGDSLYSTCTGNPSVVDMLTVLMLRESRGVGNDGRQRGCVAGIYMFCFARCFLNRVSRTLHLSQERRFEGFRRYRKDLTVSTTLRYVNPSFV